MKKVFLLIFLSFCVESFSQGKTPINVFDTLSKQAFFKDYAHHDLRSSYTLDKKGNLRRMVSLAADGLHYHKSFEDSIYAFLRIAYPKQFHSLLFFAKEDLSWKTEGGAEFSWRAGKKIEQEQLQMFLSSEDDVLQKAKRENWLEKESAGHFFFHNYFLHDSLSKNIYCYNSLNGLMDGQINYDTSNKINYEIAYYNDRKIFYEYRNGKLEVFSEQGAKLFERTSTEISALGDQEIILWQYNVSNQAFLLGSTVRDINKGYYDKIFELWRNNFVK